MKTFREFLNKPLVEASEDEKILSKVAKKAFGGGFKRVVDQGGGYYTISLSTDVVSFKDLKVLEIHLTSFILDNIDFGDADILVKKK